MHFRYPIFAIACLLHITIGGSAPCWAEEKPNVVIIFVDDIGLGDVSPYNDQLVYKTPAIQELAESGMKFMHAHSTGATCMPSRYGLISGNYVFRGRFDKGVSEACRRPQMYRRQKTLGHALKSAGYRTCFVGKYHMGGEFESLDSVEMARTFGNADLTKPCIGGPIDQGFDESLMLMVGNHGDPWAYFLNDQLARWHEPAKKFVTFSTNKSVREFFKMNKDHEKRIPLTKNRPLRHRIDNWSSTQVGPTLTHKALSFIDEAAETEKPFFLYLCLAAAHAPCTPPAKFDPSDPNGKKSEDGVRVKGVTPGERTDMVFETDLTTKAVVDKLKEKGVLGNTIVIYTSDNGAEQPGRAQWSDHRYFAFRRGAYGGDRLDSIASGTPHKNAQGTENGLPLRGSKSHVYEGGHRIPLIIRWGDAESDWKIKPGTSTDQLVGLHDVYRTLAELLGIKLKKNQAIDSVSFASVLKEEASQTPIRKFLLAQGRLPQTGEQEIALELIEEKDGAAAFNKNGLVVGSTGSVKISATELDVMIHERQMGRAIYLNDEGRTLKLLFSTRLDSQLEDVRPWELYDLTSDPTESNNLISDPNNETKVEFLLEEYRATVKQRFWNDRN